MRRWRGGRAPPVAGRRRRAGRPEVCGATMPPVLPPTTGDDWLALTADELPGRRGLRLGRAPGLRGRGAVQRHRPRPRRGSRRGRAPDVRGLRRSGRARMAAIAAEARRRWPMIGRLALLHRTGRLELGESSVLAVVSTPHRAEAFEAGRYAIDALKASVPIWKHETWREGSAWGTGATPISRRRDRRVTWILAVSLLPLVLLVPSSSSCRRHPRAPAAAPRRCRHRSGARSTPSHPRLAGRSSTGSSSWRAAPSPASPDAR